jgi:hypothetical protein
MMVGASGTARRTVEGRVARDGLDRRIGAYRPEFLGVAPPFLRTPMPGTTVPLSMVDDERIYGLIAERLPVDPPDMTFRFFRATRPS